MLKFLFLQCQEYQPSNDTLRSVLPLNVSRGDIRGDGGPNGTDDEDSRWNYGTPNRKNFRFNSDYVEHDYGNNDQQEYHPEGSRNAGSVRSEHRDYLNNYPYNSETAGRYGGYSDGEESYGSGNNDDRHRYPPGQREFNRTKYGGKIRWRIFMRKVSNYRCVCAIM